MLDILFNRRTISKDTDQNIAPESMTGLLNAAAQSSNTGKWISPLGVLTQL
jgi:hypothetical protein